MDRKKGFKKLATKIICFSVIPMILIISITELFYVFFALQSTSQLVKQEIFSETTLVTDELNIMFDELAEMLSKDNYEKIAREYIVSSDTGNASEQRSAYTTLMDTLNNIHAFNDKQIVVAALIDFRSGQLLSNASAGWQEKNYKYSDNVWYNHDKIVNNQVYITNPYKSEKPFFKNEDKIMTMVKPILSPQTKSPLGVLTIAIRYADIKARMEAVSLGKNGRMILLSNNTTVIYHPDESQVGANGTEIFNTKIEIDGITWRNSEVFDFILQGEKMLGKTSMVTMPGWYVFAVVPKSEMTARSTEAMRPVLIIYFASILLLLLLMWLMVGWIVKPIREITETTKEIAKGNYNIRLHVKSQDEIGQLARAVNSSIINLRYRADYDQLTGIYNINTMYREAQHMLEENPDKNYAVIRMDIGRFKLVNDLLGWQKGDELLKKIASMLERKLPKDSVYAHRTADIFCMCIPFEEKQEIIDLVTEMFDELRSYFENFDITPFFGIYIVDDITVPINIMCDRANMALNSIKGNMLHFYKFYDSRLRDIMIRNNKIESEMYTALEEKQFFVVFQPKCDIETGKVIGAEALVRWRHPEEGIIPPNDFIPVFEENGFILQLDEYVWEETCKALRRWTDIGYETVPVSVNVSRMHIYDGDLCDKLVKLTEKYNLPKGLLELEMTESVYMDNIEKLYTLMLDLKHSGFILSMDDFGSGYSSLNMLKDAPFDVVKFDREFLNESVESEKGKTILRSMISMVNKLEIKVLVEGVETKEQAGILLNAGCHIAQGYYYSRPIELSEFEEFAFKQNPQNAM